MYSIDISLKRSAIAISVQRKEKEDALALYQQLLLALKSESPQLIELTCEKDTEKQIAFLSDSMNAVILSQKSGATASGRAAGFFSSQSDSD